MVHTDKMGIVALAAAVFLVKAGGQLFLGDGLGGGALAADGVQHAGPAHGLIGNTLAQGQHGGLAGHAVQVFQQLQQVGRVHPDIVVRHQIIPVLHSKGAPAGDVLQQGLAGLQLIQGPGGTQHRDGIAEGQHKGAVLLLGGKHRTDLGHNRLFTGLGRHDTGQTEGALKGSRLVGHGSQLVELAHHGALHADEAGAQRLGIHRRQGRFVKNRLQRHR